MGIMIAEKGPTVANIAISGEAGHGSYPYKSVNALAIMSKIVSLIETNPPKPTITPEWMTFVKSLSLSKLNEFMLTHKHTINFAITKLEKSDLGLAKVFHALTRMTVSPNIGKAGKKVNVIPDTATIEADIRLLPGQDENEIKEYFNSIIPNHLKEKIRLDLQEFVPGSSDPWNTPFTDIMANAYKSIYPTQEASPAFIPGVTDARFFRKIGIQCYGVCVLSNQVDVSLMTQLYHGDDERVPLEAIEKSIQFFTSVCKNYLT